MTGSPRTISREAGDGAFPLPAFARRTSEARAVVADEHAQRGYTRPVAQMASSGCSQNISVSCWADRRQHVLDEHRHRPRLNRTN